MIKTLMTSSVITAAIGLVLLTTTPASAVSFNDPWCAGDIAGIVLDTDGAVHLGLLANGTCNCTAVGLFGAVNFKSAAIAPIASKVYSGALANKLAGNGIVIFYNNPPPGESDCTILGVAF